MGQQIFPLKWKTFESHLSSSLCDLFAQDTFTDVTLVSDDQIQFQAHQFILGACSPAMKNILLENSHSHPLIYLRGVMQEELRSILEFIYLGETRISQDRIGQFLNSTKDLQIKQLFQTVMTEEALSIKKVDEKETSNISNIDEGVSLDIPANEKGSDKQVYKCEEYATDFKNISGLVLHTRTHQQSENEGVRYYPCNHCEYKTTHKSHLKTHQQSRHEGLKYPCYKCEYQATQKSSLKRHTQSVHEGAKYYCKQCDYHATNQTQLRIHRKTVHEGLRYPCDQCDYQATLQSHLKTHQLSKHEGVKYSCNQCDYKSTRQAYVKAHHQSVHDKGLFLGLEGVLFRKMNNLSPV